MNQFRAFLRTLNVFFSDTEIDDHTGTFIDFRDTPNKSTEAKITKQARALGLKIDISDKGAIFH